MAKSIIIFLAFSLSIFYGAAQRRTVDSLLKIIQTKEDTSRVVITDRLIEAYRNINHDSGVYYGQQQILMIQRSNSPRHHAYALNIYGRALFFAGNYPEAMNVLLDALQKSENIPDTMEISKSYLVLGFVYRISDAYRKSIDFFTKYKIIADHYNDDEMRLRYFTETGRTYELLNILDTALLLLKQAYSLAQSKPSANIATILGHLGIVHSKLGNHKLAFDLFRQAIEKALKQEQHGTLARSYNELAKHFNKNKQIDSALYYSRKALGISNQYSFTVQKLAAGTLLTNIFKDQYKYDSAFKYQQIMLVANDSLFGREKINRIQNLEFADRVRRQEIETQREQLQNRMKIYILIIALFVFLLLAGILWRNNRQKQKANIKIEKAYEKLKTTQAQLIQSEKMASLGELIAGIAHEIQNPLNFVNNFSEVNVELLNELKEGPFKNLRENEQVEVDEIIKNLENNLEKISIHGQRAGAIVKSMLQHSRHYNVEKEFTDINELAEQYLRLSYRGIQVKDSSCNATLQTDFDQKIKRIKMVPQEIGSVLHNLYTNALYAVTEKKKNHQSQVETANLSPDVYEPTVTVKTKANGNKVLISVKDNGNGIAQKLLGKIFQPFFTTKPTGQGTGLGLSLSYDIIKAHGGELKVETREHEYAEFIIELPFTQAGE